MQRAKPHDFVGCKWTFIKPVQAAQGDQTCRESCTVSIDEKPAATAFKADDPGRKLSALSDVSPLNRLEPARLFWAERCALIIGRMVFPATFRTAFGGYSSRHRGVFSVPHEWRNRGRHGCSNGLNRTVFRRFSGGFLAVFPAESLMSGVARRCKGSQGLKRGVRRARLKGWRPGGSKPLSAHPFFGTSCKILWRPDLAQTQAGRGFERAPAPIGARNACLNACLEAP